MKVFIYSKRTSKLIKTINDVSDVQYDKESDTMWVSVCNEITSYPVSIQYNKVTIYQN